MGDLMATRSLRFGIGATLTLAAIAAPLPADHASGSCAAPYLLLKGNQRDPAVTPSSTITVQGRAFVVGCADTGTSTPGCSAPRRTPEKPMNGVTLRFRQRGHDWVVGSADAGTAKHNQLGHVTWTVKVPGGLKPGTAFLVADRAQPTRVTVRGR
jgi:hypothetical protein